MPGDSYYWSPADHDFDTEDSMLEKEPYIDPWDLENYAYIREHLDSMELSSNPSAPSGSSGEFAEPTSSFDYVPAKRKSVAQLPRIMSNIREEKFDSRFDSILSEHENYAAIDDVHNTNRKNRKTASEIYWPTRRNPMYDYETEAEDLNTYSEDSIQENPTFGIYDDKGIFRRVSLPVVCKTRDRSLSYSYGDFDNNHHFPKVDTRSAYEEFRERVNQRDDTLPIYDDTSRLNRNKPQNFGFSKYGHLKIDYSCSWNNLNKYMKYK